MNRFTQKTTPIRAFILRYLMLMSLVAALTMPPTDAQASGLHFSTSEAVLITAAVLSVAGTSVASVVVLISDGIDLFGEPEPTHWNAGWDISLAVSNGILCGIGAVNASPQDDGAIGLTVVACTASALLLSHGIWELSLLDEMGPSDESLEDQVTMSFGPTLLDTKGGFGLGMVGRF
jgi:hypothetical protein